jgi:two-component system LytT family response regulator
MKAIIVDDELPIRQTVRMFLERWFPIIEIAGEAAGVNEAVEKINQLKPDLLFLDIEIRGGTGFHVLQKVEWKSFKLIFITAFNEFALQAIKMGALDYLMKPLNEVEFKIGVEKAICAINLKDEEKVNQQITSDSPRNSTKLVLRTSTDIHIVEIKDIVHCVADNTYTTFYFRSGDKLLVSKGLSEYDELLEQHGFFRVHQSHLVNLAFIKRIEKSEGGHLHLVDGSSIPVSIRRKPLLLEVVAKL